MASVGKGRPSIVVGRGIGTALIASGVLLLASCNSATMNTAGTQDIDVIDKVKSIDILPRYPTQAGTSTATTSAGPRPSPSSSRAPR